MAAGLELIETSRPVARDYTMIVVTIPGSDIVERVFNEKDILDSFMKKAQRRDTKGAIEALINLATTVATSVPILGPFASEGFSQIWSNSSYAQIEAAIDTLEAEQQEDARARKLAQLIATFMAEALVEFSERLRNELASRSQVDQIHEKLDAFRKAFTEHNMISGNIKLLRDGATGAKFNSSKMPDVKTEINVDEAAGQDTTVIDLTT